jgi:CubicO group peptidase (beta-lactamase class C family)
MTGLGLPRAESPEQVGLSSERLDRITARLTADVEEGAIPGAVLAIVRGGQIAYAETIGYRDKEANAAMQLDAIFRIASMTKPMVSVAAMGLAEEGRLDIGAPVAQYIPALGEMTVGAERAKATRTMTVQDLLRHTSGLTYAERGDSPVQMMWRDAGLSDPDQTNEELMGKLSRLPLLFEPGTTWEYSMSTDVLGRVVEVVSGQGLAEFFATRISGPLGMPDTAFAATGAKADRLAEPQAMAGTGARPPMRNVRREPRWASGGGGLVSTAADYLKFCRMLLTGGALGGVRLLSPATIRHMTANHLPSACLYGATARERFGALAPVPEMGYGFGLGFAVRTQLGMSPVPGSPGEYSWGGVTGTYFWIDPSLDLIAIFLSQAPDRRLHYRYLLRQLVYAAIGGPAAR